MRHLKQWTKRRQAIAGAYNQSLAKHDVQLPVQMPSAEHVYHLYTLRARDRDGLQKGLQAEGVQTAVHYAEPVHLQPAYADLGYGPGSLPESEAAAREVLSLPMYPELTDDQVQMVATAFENLSAIKSGTSTR